MEKGEYPVFTDAAKKRAVKPFDMLMMSFEGQWLLKLTIAGWFSGVLCSLIAQNVEGALKVPFYTATGAFFFVSVVLFFFVTRTGHFRRARYNEQRLSLKLMGVKRPMKFIREHPKHMDAYLALKAELNNLSELIFLDVMYGRHHDIAMLVFTGEDRHLSGPAIISIIQNRGVIDPVAISELLNETETHPSALGNGAL